MSQPRNRPLALVISALLVWGVPAALGLAHALSWLPEQLTGPAAFAAIAVAGIIATLGARETQRPSRSRQTGARDPRG